jgi:hypothetical protein
VAGILKNLEVTIRNVHIRYEDKQKPNSARHSFSSGATLKSVTMRTTSNLEEGTSAKLMVITKSLKTTVYKKKKHNKIISEVWLYFHLLPFSPNKMTNLRKKYSV